MKYEPDKLSEVTEPVTGDEVYVHTMGAFGEIIEHDKKSDDYRIRIINNAKIYARASDFEVKRYDTLPMWSFDSDCDERWLEDGNGIETMSEFGF